ncbi:hypothetical protein Tco_1016286 [Tanacetum coccineum]|uniref:Uncharacterized protein n=1 Tax=Tanacetum coccineum TaxID=301880 RepID=A0ABQ5FN78_9ASTR
MGLWYPKDNVMSLIAYVDADHAGCRDSKRSTSGSAQFLEDRLVSWSSKKQRSTTISTTEAEYIAMSGAIATRFSFEGKIVVLKTAVPNNGALSASADVPSSVTETTDTTSTLQPPPPPLQKPTVHRDIW